MNDRFGLLIQALPNAPQRVLVMGDLVASRDSGHLFRPSDISSAFRELQVPAPGNISRELSRLAERKFTMLHRPGVWSLTPAGRKHVQEIVGDSASTLHSVGTPSAEFAHVEHTVIPPWAAPPRWQVGIKRLLDVHPFDTNVFCMTRFPSEGPIPDPVTKAVVILRNTLKNFGLTLHLASDGLVDDDLLTNVGSYMWGSRYGIGIVENRMSTGVNYNAVIELGGMIVTGRRCAILKDTTVDKMPTDLAGHVYRSVNIASAVKVAAEIEAWATNDLRLSRV